MALAVATFAIAREYTPDREPPPAVIKPIPPTSLAVIPEPLPVFAPVIPFFVDPSAAITASATSTEKSSSADSPQKSDPAAPRKEVPPSAPQKSSSPAKTTPTASPQAATTSQTQATSPVDTPEKTDLAAASLRLALVNIVCSAPQSAGIHSTSGSGVMIDHKGIVLTNSHVAQHFLLTDLGVSCKIRTGSPAKNAYTAAPIFISQRWIEENADALLDETPSGTGEHDYAFLAVTGSLTGTTLPSGFAFVPLGKLAPAKQEAVTIGSYGAQFLDSSQVESALHATIVPGSVKDVFTFEKTTVDVIALGGSAAAQEGSSGGGVVNKLGILAATITTSTTEGDFSSRNINAITAPYMRRAFEKEAKENLDAFLAKPVDVLVKDFSFRIPELKKLLTAKLSE